MKIISKIYDIQELPIVIVGNKTDCVAEYNSKAIEEFSLKSKIKYFMTSTRLNIGYQNAFDYLVEKIVGNKKPK